MYLLCKGTLNVGETAIGLGLTSVFCSSLQVDGTQDMEEVFADIDEHLVKLSENRTSVLAN